ncbi:SSI family serine proteinase inhibitor [Actinomadura sp. NBRC 104412]|uniref:SSI family serine proteinase inhibitor n=1 Tax=Actinomadura sp. NBRC 104412 TaxID=3032203 RepID=UPI002556E3AD|nr:SSI family serine proteinase inhibitor [Actinomadura sp. NBRC 104412]
MRYRTLLFTAPGLAMILASAGCGSEQASNQPANDPADRSPATSSVSPSAQGDTLTIQVKASPQAPARTWTLRCDPVGGDHPKAEQACAKLAATQDPFKPTPAGQMCTKIYGGPEVATVQGTWRDQPVNARFTRGDGCELNRWSKIAPLFGNVPKVR